MKNHLVPYTWVFMKRSPLQIIWDIRQTSDQGGGKKDEAKYDSDSGHVLCDFHSLTDPGLHLTMLYGFTEKKQAFRSNKVLFYHL